MKYGRLILLLFLYGLLLGGGWAAGKWLPEVLGLGPGSLSGPAAQMMILATAGIFVIVTAIPFVPGAEIGLGLIMLMGKEVLALVYGSMVLALLISYLVGRFIPARKTAAAFRFFGLSRAAGLALQMAPLNPRERLAYLTENTPRRMLPILLKYRFLALFVVLNIPGNGLIGGGGGIAFIAGLSGIFPFPAYLITILLAVAPLPLFILITGSTF